MAKKKQIDFKAITLRSEITTRGGGMEIDLSTLGFKGERMTAYQNYLGGGMMGRVCSNNTIGAYKKPITDTKLEKLNAIAEELKMYFHQLTNPEGEWEKTEYERNQKMPVSAY